MENGEYSKSVKCKVKSEKLDEMENGKLKMENESNQVPSSEFQVLHNFSTSQLKNFERFTNELLKWNRVHKLTNYKTKEALLSQIEDSLYPIEWVEGESAIDIGTGAGFPGLILAIAKPEIKWYLVEPLKKRYSFLNYIKTILDLKNVEVVPKRLEESNLEKVDLITSRAVTKTPTLLEISKPFLKKDGKILLYKGSSVLDELDTKAKIKTRGNRNYVLIENGE